MERSLIGFPDLNISYKYESSKISPKSVSSIIAKLKPRPEIEIEKDEKGVEANERYKPAAVQKSRHRNLEPTLSTEVPGQSSPLRSLES